MQGPGVGQGVEGERKFNIGWQGWPLREAGGEKVIPLRLCVLRGRLPSRQGLGLSMRIKGDKAQSVPGTRQVLRRHQLLF